MIPGKFRGLIHHGRQSLDDRLLANLGLALVLGLGAYLRLRDLDLDWFIVDQARDLRTAMGIVEGRAFPLVGPEVQGGPAHTWGPLYFYLLAVPLAFSPSPLGAAIFLSSLNLMAVYLTYRFGARFFGRGIGLMGAALFATAPLAVVSGRGLWNLAPMPLFALGLLYCLFLVVIDRRSVMIVPALVILGGIIQLHFSGVAFLAVFASILAVYRPRLRWRHLVLGTAGFSVLVLPYLVAQTLDGWRDVRAMLAFSHGALGLSRLRDIWPALQPAFFASADLTQWLDQTFGQSPATWLGPIVQRAAGYLFLIGSGYLVVRALADLRHGLSSGAAVSRPRGYGLLALWIWTPLILLLFKSGLRPWYYQDVLYPAPFLAGAIVWRDVIASVGSRFERDSRTLWRVAAGVSTALIVAADIGSLLYLRTLTERLGAMPIPAAAISGGPAESSGSLALMPMRYKERIVGAIVGRTAFAPSTFYRHVHGYPFDGVIEDGGFFFDAFAMRRRERAPVVTGSAPHYAIIGPWLARRPEVLGSLPRIGPFTIIEYQPLVDYQSWTYATADTVGGAADNHWVPVEIPTRGIPGRHTYPYPQHFLWPATPILLRGVIDVPRRPTSFRLVVSLRWSHVADGYRVDECRLNGAIVPRDGAASTATLSGVTSETVFEASDSLHEGRNIVICRISGAGQRFDLDVYELRS